MSSITTTISTRHRRRFHGYCPPTGRKESTVDFFEDDYTTNLNGLVDLVMSPKEVRFNLSEQISGACIQICLSNLDEEEEEEEMRARDSTGIHRRRNGSNSRNDAESVVTSLSFESRDSLPVILDLLQAELHGELREESKEEPLMIEEPEETDLAHLRQSQFSNRANVEFISKQDDGPPIPTEREFQIFRLNYLLVTMAIMLADGLQGTHLYVLYSGYGYSVASLYCLGFFTGAVTAPITNPLVDKIGRKKAALIYCALEVFINMLEQYPILAGLIASRMIGGVTTNLLSSVFETWLVTEYRRRGFDEQKYEIVMRDSVVVSNLAAIASGYLAHQLAERFGAVGPFEGAVACTAIALVIVAMVWNENYGTAEKEDQDDKSVGSYLSDAVETFKTDSKVLRVGIIQGLTTGSIQIFIFLWSPALLEFAKNAPKNVLGLDSAGEPAFGLIFGAFMAFGVLGGLIAPFLRRGVTLLLSPLTKVTPQVVEVEGEGVVRPMAVEFLAASCYLLCAGLLLTPCIVSSEGALSFSVCVAAFLAYEFFIGIYMPCEGVIRSIYIPSDARCSLLTVPRMIVNIAVSVGVISTEYLSLHTAFAAVSCLMIISAILQLSLVSSREWAELSGKVDRLQRRVSRSLSFSSGSSKKIRELRRSLSETVVWDSDTSLSSGAIYAEEEKKDQ